MGKVLSGKLSSPCDRSCYPTCDWQNIVAVLLDKKFVMYSDDRALDNREYWMIFFFISHGNHLL